MRRRTSVDRRVWLPFAILGVGALGGAALVVMHDLELALRHATHVAVLHRGRLHAAGKVAQILTPAVLHAVFEVEAEIVHHSRGSWLHVFGPSSESCGAEGSPIS